MLAFRLDETSMIDGRNNVIIEEDFSLLECQKLQTKQIKYWLKKKKKNHFQRFFLICRQRKKCDTNLLSQLSKQRLLIKLNAKLRTRILRTCTVFIHGSVCSRHCAYTRCCSKYTKSPHKVSTNKKQVSNRFDKC